MGQPAARLGDQALQAAPHCQLQKYFAPGDPHHQNSHTIFTIGVTPKVFIGGVETRVKLKLRKGLNW